MISEIMIQTIHHELSSLIGCYETLYEQTYAQIKDLKTETLFKVSNEKLKELMEMINLKKNGGDMGSRTPDL